MKLTAVAMIAIMLDTAANSSFEGRLAVFLDRDGVINRKMPEGQYVQSWQDFHLLPQVAEAIARLNRANYRVIVVTNQRGIALGIYTPADVREIHSRLQNLLSSHQAHVDGFYFCPHDQGTCNCRKPLPGLFKQALGDFPEITAATSVMIGDSESDIEFGNRLGMQTIFIDGEPHTQKLGAEAARHLATKHFSSLADAVDYLVR